MAFGRQGWTLEPFGGFLDAGEGEIKVSRGPSVTLTEWTVSRVKETGRNKTNVTDVNVIFPRSAAHEDEFHQALVHYRTKTSRRTDTLELRIPVYGHTLGD